MTFLYNLAFFIFGLLYLPVFLVKIRQAEDRRQLLRERLGLFPRAMKERFLGRKVLWIHAVSVGEVAAVEPFVRKWLERCPQYHLVLTTVTPTGQKAARQMESERVTVCYFPFDFSFAVRNFFKVMGPECLFLVETEIWPNLLAGARRAKVPVGILNARLSAKSARRYNRFRTFFQPLFDGMSFVLAQGVRDADRFASAGMDPARIHVLGNMKYDNSFEMDTGKESLLEMKKNWGFLEEDTIVMAGSTHPGEEEIVAHVFLNLTKRYPTLKCLVAPRHVERCPQIAASLRKKGLKVQLASERVSGESSFQVLLLDRMGVLKQLYAVSDAVFMGGSLVRHGGQNPIEPAFFKRAILHGPFVFNFENVYQVLDQEGGALLVRDESQLCFALGRLLSNARERTLLGENAFEAVSKLRGATDRHLEWCLKYLTSKSKVERMNHAEFREKLFSPAR